MSAGSGTGIKSGNLESRQLLATGSPPSEINSIPEAVHPVGQHPYRALKKVPVPVGPAITAVVAADPRADGSFVISGRTYPKAKVSLALQADGAIERTAKANAEGQYRVVLPASFGSTPVRLTATARGHQATSTTLTVSNTQTPPILPSGSTGSSQSGSQGGSHSPFDFGPSSDSSEWYNAYLAIWSSLGAWY
jgi:hypothetical protein